MYGTRQKGRKRCLGRKKIHALRRREKHLIFRGGGRGKYRHLHVSEREKPCSHVYLDEVAVVAGGVEQDHGPLRAGLELEEDVAAGQAHLKGGQLDDAVLAAEGD
jgi:hypothetical protein